MRVLLRRLPLLLALAACAPDGASPSDPFHDDPDPDPDPGCSDTGWFAWWPDADGDGYGDLDRDHEEGGCIEDVPAGWTASGYAHCHAGERFPPGYDTCEERWADCDDADPAVHPDAEERWYDGADADCDGESDYDADRDGYDAAPHGGNDCSDDDAERHPLAPERCDGDDDDCDGAVDVPRCGAHRDVSEVDVVLETSVAWLQQRGLLNVGDTDGDGVDDLLLDTYDAGAWLVGAPVPKVLPEEAAATLGGTKYLEVGSAGDLDGDGFADLWIGDSSPAESWILPGPIAGHVEAASATWSLGDGPAWLARIPGDDDRLAAGGCIVALPLVRGASLGECVGTVGEGDGALGAGDLDGDGIGDLAVTDGATLRVYLGPLVGAPTADGAWGSTDWSSTARAAGDVDGDGLDDLAVGVPFAEAVEGSWRGMPGALYVLPGPATGAHPVAEAPIEVRGERPEDGEGGYFGLELAAAGDVDGDGRGDLLASGSVAGPDRGGIWLLHGLSAGSWSAGTVGDRWTGDDATYLGGAVVAGDFDGDGVGDLVFGTTSSVAAAWFLRGE